MHRHVSASLELTLSARTNLVFAIAAARPGDGATLTETLRFEGAGTEYEAVELADVHGTRLHQFVAEAGGVTAYYEADIAGRAAPVAVEPLDLITYLRPSRYAESDSLLPTAMAEFGGLAGRDLLAGVSSWVGSHLSYVPGASEVTDGATQTLLDRRGVCRDYAHLCVALLRALDVPARVVSVYAPGLMPMDFHAVCEAFVDGQWHVVDATALAPRQTLVRIATGRDAADTAFLTSHGGWVTLQAMSITAIADELPRDHVASFVTLG
ncbi:transglutaminase-like domain-containing protein [Naasia aerilata]|uniref:Transglutaminase-like protein n=1 Tax=Naasia aerilata TaxID=1162966 RepID=A0ABN6XKQ5_9MICO|nr:transglutaminase family protein [Naasia aerilata]BDZ44235.1 putative transglutaminase-like protein [Naasia aerilata]